MTYINEFHPLFCDLQKDIVEHIDKVKESLKLISPGTKRRKEVYNHLQLVIEFNNAATNCIEAQRKVIEAQLKYMDQIRQEIRQESLHRESIEKQLRETVQKLRYYEPQY